MKLKFIFAALLLWAGSAPSLAKADASAVTDPDRDKAAQFFRAGQEAFLRGDYVVAAHSFEQAHGLLPSGPTIYNAARAWDRLSEAPSALAAYEEALTQADLSEAQRGHARKRVDELHKQGIVAPPHPKPPEPAMQPIVQSPPPVAPIPAEAVPAPIAHRAPNYLGWTGVSVAAAGVAASAICGGIFLAKRHEFVDGGRTSASSRSDAMLWGKLTSAALATTLVGAGVALWGFHTAKRGERLDVALQFTANGLDIRGAF